MKSASLIGCARKYSHRISLIVVADPALFLSAKSRSRVQSLGIIDDVGGTKA
jgi:hypothetical protein